MNTSLNRIDFLVSHLMTSNAIVVSLLSAKIFFREKVQLFPAENPTSRIQPKLWGGGNFADFGGAGPKWAKAAKKGAASDENPPQ